MIIICMGDASPHVVSCTCLHDHKLLQLGILRYYSFFPVLDLPRQVKKTEGGISIRGRTQSRMG